MSKAFEPGAGACATDAGLTLDLPLPRNRQMRSEK